MSYILSAVAPQGHKQRYRQSTDQSTMPLLHKDNTSQLLLPAYKWMAKLLGKKNAVLSPPKDRWDTRDAQASGKPRFTACALLYVIACSEPKSEQGLIGLSQRQLRRTSCSVQLQISPV